MKKALLALILISSVMLSLAGCAVKDFSEAVTSSQSDDKTNTVPSDNTNQNPDSRDPDQSIPGGVSSVFENYEVMEGDTVALKVSLNMPVAEISDNEEIRAKLTERLDFIKSDISDYISRIEALYINSVKESGAALFTPSVLVSFVLNDFTEKAISITFNITETNAYGVTTYTSRHYNYELDFASPITCSTIFNDSDSVIAMLCERARQKEGLFSNFETLISSLAESRWYMDNGSIVFSFNPYDIAPASYGYVDFIFSSSEISPYLSEYGKDLFGVS